MEPVSASGAIGSTPGTWTSRSRPRIARAWFAAMMAGQPPGSCAAIQSIASASARAGVGSPVPVQSNSRRNRSRPRSGSFAPCEIDQRVDPVAAVGPDREDGRALRAAQPLVAVAGPVGGPEGGQVDWHHPRGVGGIDERVDPARLELGDDPFDREHERGRAGDVADQQEAGPGRDRCRGWRRGPGPGPRSAAGCAR